MFLRAGPLPRGTWEALNRREPIVQLPWMVRPVALAYKGAAGVQLSPCTLAKIMLGQIKDWSDVQVGLAVLLGSTIESCTIMPSSTYNQGTC